MSIDQEIPLIVTDVTTQGQIYKGNTPLYIKDLVAKLRTVKLNDYNFVVSEFNKDQYNQARIHDNTMFDSVRAEEWLKRLTTQDSFYNLNKHHQTGQGSLKGLDSSKQFAISPVFIPANDPTFAGLQELGLLLNMLPEIEFNNDDLHTLIMALWVIKPSNDTIRRMLFFLIAQYLNTLLKPTSSVQELLEHCKNNYQDQQGKQIGDQGFNFDLQGNQQFLQTLANDQILKQKLNLQGKTEDNNMALLLFQLSASNTVWVQQQTAQGQQVMVWNDQSLLSQGIDNITKYNVKWHQAAIQCYQDYKTKQKDVDVSKEAKYISLHNQFSKQLEWNFKQPISLDEFTPDKKFEDYLKPEINVFFTLRDLAKLWNTVNKGQLVMDHALTLAAGATDVAIMADPDSSAKSIANATINLILTFLFAIFNIKSAWRRHKVTKQKEKEIVTATQAYLKEYDQLIKCTSLAQYLLRSLHLRGREPYKFKFVSPEPDITDYRACALGILQGKLSIVVIQSIFTDSAFRQALHQEFQTLIKDELANNTETLTKLDIPTQNLQLIKTSKIQFSPADWFGNAHKNKTFYVERGWEKVLDTFEPIVISMSAIFNNILCVGNPKVVSMILQEPRHFNSEKIVISYSSMSPQTQMFALVTIINTRPIEFAECATKDQINILLNMLNTVLTAEIPKLDNFYRVLLQQALNNLAYIFLNYSHIMLSKFTAGLQATSEAALKYKNLLEETQGSDTIDPAIIEQANLQKQVIEDKIKAERASDVSALARSIARHQILNNENAQLFSKIELNDRTDNADQHCFEQWIKLMNPIFVKKMFRNLKKPQIIWTATFATLTQQITIVNQLKLQQPLFKSQVSSEIHVNQIIKTLATLDEQSWKNEHRNLATTIIGQWVQGYQAQQPLTHLEIIGLIKCSIEFVEIANEINKAQQQQIIIIPITDLKNLLQIKDIGLKIKLLNKIYSYFEQVQFLVDNYKDQTPLMWQNFKTLLPSPKCDIQMIMDITKTEEQQLLKKQEIRKETQIKISESFVDIKLGHNLVQDEVKKETQTLEKVKTALELGILPGLMTNVAFESQQLSKDVVTSQQEQTLSDLNEHDFEAMLLGAKGEDKSFSLELSSDTEYFTRQQLLDWGYSEEKVNSWIGEDGTQISREAFALIIQENYNIPFARSVFQGLNKDEIEEVQKWLAVYAQSGGLDEAREVLLMQMFRLYDGKDDKIDLTETFKQIEDGNYTSEEMIVIVQEDIQSQYQDNVLESYISYSVIKESTSTGEEQYYAVNSKTGVKTGPFDTEDEAQEEITNLVYIDSNGGLASLMFQGKYQETLFITEITKIQIVVGLGLNCSDPETQEYIHTGDPKYLWGSTVYIEMSVQRYTIFFELVKKLPPETTAENIKDLLVELKKEGYTDEQIEAIRKMLEPDKTAEELLQLLETTQKQGESLFEAVKLQQGGANPQDIYNKLSPQQQAEFNRGYDEINQANISAYLISSGQNFGAHAARVFDSDNFMTMNLINMELDQEQLYVLTSSLPLGGAGQMTQGQLVQVMINFATYYTGQQPTIEQINLLFSHYSGGPIPLQAPNTESTIVNMQTLMNNGVTEDEATSYLAIIGNDTMTFGELNTILSSLQNFTIQDLDIDSLPLSEQNLAEVFGVSPEGGIDLSLSSYEWPSAVYLAQLESINDWNNLTEDEIKVIITALERGASEDCAYIFSHIGIVFKSKQPELYQALIDCKSKNISPIYQIDPNLGTGSTGSQDPGYEFINIKKKNTDYMSQEGFQLQYTQKQVIEGIEQTIINKNKEYSPKTVIRIIGSILPFLTTLPKVRQNMKYTVEKKHTNQKIQYREKQKTEQEVATQRNLNFSSSGLRKYIPRFEQNTITKAANNQNEQYPKQNFNYQFEDNKQIVQQYWQYDQENNIGPNTLYKDTYTTHQGYQTQGLIQGRDDNEVKQINYSKIRRSATKGKT